MIFFWLIVSLLLISIIISILIRKKRGKINDLLATVFDGIEEIVFIANKSGKLIYKNKKFEELAPKSSNNINETVKVENKKGIKEPFFNFIINNLKEDEILKALILFAKKSFSAKIKYKIEKNYYIFFINDLSLEDDYIKNLNKSLYFDYATKLPNKEYFTDKLNTTMAQAKLHNKRFVLLFLEISNYQSILNFLGLGFTNKLLIQIANILNKKLQSKAFISIISESKFAIIVSDIKSLNEFKELIKPVIKKLSGPFNIDNHTTFLSINIGATFFPYFSKDQDELIKYTNFALLESKKQNYPILFFSEALKSRVEKIESVKNLLPTAIKNREFEIFFQPKLNILTNKITSAEVLIRWKNKNISPALFIPIAEETGDIVKIGDFVIESAIKFLYHRKRENKPLVKLAINISQKQMKNFKVIELFSKLIKKYGVNPSFLEAEITESAIEDKENIINIINGFHKIGICVSLDDFGTGYSSLHFLSKLPVDKIKIDKSFIDQYKDEKARAILKNIFDIANTFKFKTVVEGIENIEQFNLIKSFGCHQAQGYYISKPLNSKDFDKFLKLNMR